MSYISEWWSLVLLRSAIRCQGLQAPGLACCRVRAVPACPAAPHLGPGPASFTSLPCLGPCRADPPLLAALRTLLAVLDPAETTQVMGTCLHVCPSPPPSQQSGLAQQVVWG